MTCTAMSSMQQQQQCLSDPKHNYTMAAHPITSISHIHLHTHKNMYSIHTYVLTYQVSKCASG
jgi:hypothetical protein